jgi:hypothetical protein
MRNTKEKERRMTVCGTMDIPLGELLLIGEPTGEGVTLTSLSMPGTPPPSRSPGTETRKPSPRLRGSWRVLRG